MAEFAEKIRIQGVRCLTQTQKAICVMHDDWDEPVWIPQSQIDDESEVWHEGQVGELVVSEWIAAQKGIR